MKSKRSETNFVGKITTRTIQTKSENIDTSKYGEVTTHGRCGTFLQYESVIFSPPKTQQVFLTKSVFEEPWLVMKITTSTKTP